MDQKHLVMILGSKATSYVKLSHFILNSRQADLLTRQLNEADGREIQLKELAISELAQSRDHEREVKGVIFVSDEVWNRSFESHIPISMVSEEEALEIMRIISFRSEMAQDSMELNKK